jgi:hypothetical protein
MPISIAATRYAAVWVSRSATPHKDRLFEIEKAIDVTALMQAYGCYLTLKPATNEKPFRFHCEYLPIG